MFVLLVMSFIIADPIFGIGLGLTIYLEVSVTTMTPCLCGFMVILANNAGCCLYIIFPLKILSHIDCLCDLLSNITKRAPLKLIVSGGQSLKYTPFLTLLNLG